MCFEKHWPTFSGGLILVALAIWNHLSQKKKKSACFFLHSFFPLLFFSFHALHAWKNLLDCIKPDATGIVHFLMRSRVYWLLRDTYKKFKNSLLGEGLEILASNVLFLSPPVENTYRPGHVYPWRYYQKFWGYWSLRHLIRMSFPWTM